MIPFLCTEKSVHKKRITHQSLSDDSFEVMAARYFYDLAKKDYPNYVRYQFGEVRNQWAAEIVKMQEKYGHSQDDIRLVFRYIREVDEFWNRNILAVTKLLKLDKNRVRYFDLMLDLAHKMEPKKEIASSGMTIAKGEAKKLIEKLGLKKPKEQTP